MEHFELVEKLREKAGLTYEEAKLVLEESNWDLLEAMVRLENTGRMNSAHKAQAEAPQGAAQQAAGHADDTKAQAQEKAQAAREQRMEKTDGMLHTAGSFLSRIADLGMRNTLEMRRDGKAVMSLPLLVVVLLMLVAFWLVVPAAVVAMLMGFRFGLKGKEIERVTKREDANT